jgi:hypothetical protein
MIETGVIHSLTCGARGLACSIKLELIRHPVLVSGALLSIISLLVYQEVSSFMEF